MIRSIVRYIYHRGIYGLKKEIKEILAASLGPIAVYKENYASSLGLVDFALGVVNSVLNLPKGQVKSFWGKGGGGGGGQIAEEV